MVTTLSDGRRAPGRDQRNESARRIAERQRASRSQRTSVPAGTNTRPTPTGSAAGNVTQMQAARGTITLEATRKPIEPERAELSSPSFSNQFKGGSTSRNNDQSRRSSSPGGGSGSSPLSGNAVQAQTSGNGQREGSQASVLRGSAARSNRGDLGFEKRVERLQEYEQRVEGRFQRSQDVLRVVPGLRGDNYVQRGVRYGAAGVGAGIPYLAERGIVSFQKGYAALEGLSKKESRQDTKKELARARYATPKAALQSFNPEKPEGAVNLITLPFGVRALKTSPAPTAPKPPQTKFGLVSTAEQKATLNNKGLETSPRAVETFIDQLYKETGGAKPKNTPEVPYAYRERTFTSRFGRGSIDTFRNERGEVIPRKPTSTTVRYEIKPSKEAIDLGIKRSSEKSFTETFNLRSQRLANRNQPATPEVLQMFDKLRGREKVPDSKNFFDSKVDPVYPLKLDLVPVKKKVFTDVNGVKTYKEVTVVERQYVPDYSKKPVYVSKQTGRPVSDVTAENILEAGRKKALQSTKKKSVDLKQKDANIKNFFEDSGFDKRGELRSVLKRTKSESPSKTFASEQPSPKPNRSARSVFDEFTQRKSTAKEFYSKSPKSSFRSGARSILPTTTLLSGVAASQKKSPVGTNFTPRTNQNQIPKPASDTDNSQKNDDGQTIYIYSVIGGSTRLASQPLFDFPTLGSPIGGGSSSRTKDDPFFKFPKPRDGGGLGVRRGFGGGGKQEFAFRRSLTGIELGLKVKSRKATGYGGFEVR